MKEFVHTLIESGRVAPHTLLELFKQVYCSSDLLQILELARIAGRSGSKLTFFFLGSLAKKHPALVKSLAKAGHEIGTHGMYHLSYRLLSYNQAREDLECSLKIFKQLGINVKGFRPPFLSVNQTTHRLCADLGLSYISSLRNGEPLQFKDTSLWELPIVSPYDWELIVKNRIQDRRRLIDFFTKNLKNRSVFLFHPWVIKKVGVSLIYSLLNHPMECMPLSEIAEGGKGFGLSVDVGKISSSDLLPLL